MTHRWVVSLGLAALVLLWFALLTVSFAEERGAWFKSLRQPGNGLSCCDVSDCAKTQAKWNGDHWIAIVHGYARIVTSDKVLRSPHSLDGEAYVCASNTPPLDASMIYCFVPPDFGS